MVDWKCWERAGGRAEGVCQWRSSGHPSARNRSRSLPAHGKGLNIL